MYMSGFIINFKMNSISQKVRRSFLSDICFFFFLINAKFLKLTIHSLFLVQRLTNSELKAGNIHGLGKVGKKPSESIITPKLKYV